MRVCAVCVCVCVRASVYAQVHNAFEVREEWFVFFLASRKWSVATVLGAHERTKRVQGMSV